MGLLSFDAPAPARKEGLLSDYRQDTLRAYAPTPRDRMALAFTRALGDTRFAADMSRRLLGSDGIGNTGLGAIDFIPGIGTALQLDEAGAQMTGGHPLAGAASAAMAAVPVAGPALKAGARKAGGMIGKAGAKAIEALAPKAEEAVQGFTAYHGSPHTFDQFDASKIGTGEGNQAYGNGLYFAENEAVAKGYRDDLTAARVNGARRILEKANGDIDAAIADRQAEIARLHALPNAGNNPERRDMFVKLAAEQLAELQNMKRGGVTKGSMYQVRVKADPNAFIDYDKPLREQPPNVRAALGYKGAPTPPSDPELNAIVQRALRDADGDPRQVGMVVDNDSSLYRRALAHAERAGVDHEHDAGGYIESAAADYLKALEAGHASNDDLMRLYQGKEADLAKQGIPGVKYLDFGSRSNGEGSRNFVVFDPRIVDIMKRYGVTATVAAGIAAGTIQPPRQRK